MISEKPELKNRKALYVNDPSLIDESGFYRSKAAGGDEDCVRVFVPLDLSHDQILTRLDLIISTYKEANEDNEMSFSADVNRILRQIDVYDEYWSQKENLKPDEHSLRTQRLVHDFIERLQEIPDGGAEIFPFEMIDELKNRYLESA